MAYQVKIENFEGPLDLLLHLIKKNEMDIYDIPMAAITAQYLAFIDAMKNLNLDVAGEFLLMAATLIHIKSRLLLPASEEEEQEEEEEDPRAELVRRLLEYQKYKDAAEMLDAFPQLQRDVFVRDFLEPEAEVATETEFEAVGIYELVEAFRFFLKEHPEAPAHEVDAERLSVTERIHGILDLFNSRENLLFTELFSEKPDRHEIVVTFLAMLELVKLRLLRLMQNEKHGPIWLYPAEGSAEGATCPVDEETLGYH
ncbi:segregation/condensation protein A [Desulfuromonas sp. AOP6]|uniref:segregation and condensation protein A n=1 Tax=Desulfuromonas sp. AOP6 TaxID=1566351 RepID=UPI0012812BED|nr:segregation/condensation protein A [Desulfuromonas sp. AOP6]BCA80054.1 segregation and condensation protein A [Desulfuromonas sp. AOP6]